MRCNAIGLLANIAFLGGLVGALAGCPGTQAVSLKDQKSGDARLNLCKDFLNKHDLVTANTECDRAIKLNPTLSEAYLVKGLIAFINAKDTQNTLEVDGCLTGVDAEAGHKELEKFLNQADESFAKAVKVAPDYGEAWSDRGTVHTLLEDYSSAAEFFTKALENPARLDSPGLTRAHLAWALFHQDKFVEAANELRQALQFQPNMCVATYRLARVYFARQEWEKAAELFDKASTDPKCGSQEASFFLMKTRLQQGLADDARTARDACLKISARSCIASQCRADGAALGHP